MKDFKSAKASIDTNITANGTQSITGGKLNSVLTEMIEASESEVGKKQDSISDLADIRAGAAKGATALQSVPAEYVTEDKLNEKGYLTKDDVKDFATVEDLKDKQDVLKDGENIKTINGESILGNGNLEIQAGESYDDTEIKKQIAQKQDNLVSGKNIKTINGQSIVGSGDIEIKGGSDIDPSNFATKDELNDKQDKISDLDAIRSGAALGATALQSVPAGYVTTTDLQTEIDLVEIQIAGVVSAIPTKTSQLNNDNGLATEDYVNQQVRNSIIFALNTEV